ncbi:hypothetical protein BT69DRAFT_1358234 [Atractiella rhizophila]|nr:hypothetical protein BT69DRAFT_1358234 [Atractiella rhizophila]
MRRRPIKSKRQGSLKSVTWISSLSILSPLFASACQSLIFKKPFIQTTFQLNTLHATLLAKPSLAHFVREILFIPRASDFEERVIQEDQYERERVHCETKAENLKNYLDKGSDYNNQIDNWRKGIRNIIQLCCGSLRSIRMVSMPPAVYLDSSVCDLFRPLSVPKLEMLEFGTVSFRDAIIINSVFEMLDQSHCPTIVFRQVSSLRAPGAFRSPRVASRLTIPANRFLAQMLSTLKLYQSRIAPTDLQDILLVSPLLSSLHFLDTYIVCDGGDLNDEKLWSSPFLKCGEQLKELSFKWIENDGYGVFFWIYQEAHEHDVWGEVFTRILEDIFRSCRNLLSLEINTMYPHGPGPLWFIKLLPPSLKYLHLTLPYWRWGDDREQPELDLLMRENHTPKLAPGLERFVLGLIPAHSYGSSGPRNFMEVIGKMFLTRYQSVDMWIERERGKQRMLVPWKEWLKE